MNAMKLDQRISELDQEYGAHSSTYKTVLSFWSRDLPKWWRDNWACELLPGYNISELLLSPDTLLKLAQFRRDPYKFSLRITDRKYKKVFRFQTSLIVTDPPIREVLSALILDGYQNKKDDNESFDLVNEVSKLLASHSKEQILKAIGLAEPPQSLESKSTFELLEEVERRYKTSLGPEWYKAIVSSPPQRDKLRA